jgi:hypothetical protein
MSNAAAASADADVNSIEIMMQSPQVSELNRLKMLRIQRLENDLQQNAEQEEQERRQSAQQNAFGVFGDAFDGHPWGGPGTIRASQIREQIRFLQEGMRKPISEKIFSPDGVELTKEEFQRRVGFHDFFFGKPGAWGPPNRDTSKYDLTGWTIPSLDGIVFSQCRVVQLGGMHHACNVSLSKCRIRTLGSVELPQGQGGSVSFANNDITQLERVRFPSCERINLRDNFITSLRGCTFLEGTAEINLENNFISNLEDLNFGALPMSLKRIILDGNPITDGLSYDQKETLTRKILYEISEAHNPLPLARPPPRASNASAPPAPPPPRAPSPSGPPASAPPDVDFGNLFFGGGGVKRPIKKIRKSLRKFKRNNSKRNNKRSFRK